MNRGTATSARAGWAALKPLLDGPPQLTLAVAESLTVGQVQARVGSVSGASSFFLGGVTAYTLDQKMRWLGVERGLAEPVDCVSAEVAVAMARGAAERFGSDLAVATTGYAERPPAPQADDPFAWWALVHRGSATEIAVRTGRIVCPGRPTRTMVQTFVADAVMEELLAYLTAWRAGGGR